MVDLRSGGGIDALGEQGDDRLIGGDGENLLSGGLGNDVLEGNNAADYLFGDRGSDQILGGAGNDLLDGGDGTDTLNGGDGNDTYITDGTDILVGSPGIDHVMSTASIGLAAGLETLTLLGTAVAGSGNSSANTILGNSGNNTLNGLSGNDTLNGGDGIDRLIGGRGKDLLTGGAARDIFDFDSTRDTVKGGKRDQILDFTHSDDIDLKTIDAETGGGNQKFKWIGKQGFHDAKGELRYIDKGARCIVQGDVNGDGKADFELFVKIGSLTKGDFLL